MVASTSNVAPTSAVKSVEDSCNLKYHEIQKTSLFTSGVVTNFNKGTTMICFLCKQPILPHNGYFKTDMWNKTLMCHPRCQPKFYWDNKPIEDGRQCSLFEGEKDEKTVQPGDS
jgi:hypothetical protein